VLALAATDFRGCRYPRGGQGAAKEASRDRYNANAIRGGSGRKAQAAPWKGNPSKDSISRVLPAEIGRTGCERKKASRARETLKTQHNRDLVTPGQSLLTSVSAVENKTLERLEPGVVPVRDPTGHTPKRSVSSKGRTVVSTVAGGQSTSCKRP